MTKIALLDFLVVALDLLIVFISSGIAVQLYCSLNARGRRGNNSALSFKSLFWIERKLYLFQMSISVVTILTKA